MNELRINFKEGKQREFIKEVIKKLNCDSFKSLSLKYINIPYSTFKKYYQEECKMPISLFKKLCSISKIKYNSLNVEYLPGNWGAIKGGKKGIVNMREKYKSKLLFWRSKGGVNSLGRTNLKKIKYPPLNEKLAEFIGAYLGDGTITPNFIRISGDTRYDLSYFNYLSKLVKNLFDIRTSYYTERKNQNVSYLLICSKRLCYFLNKSFKISFGDKKINQTGIPVQILNSKRLSIACLRGLVDTDGSVSRRGRKGSQFCVQFSNENRRLLKQASNLGKKLKVFTYLTGSETGTNNWENVLKYFRIVGSSNLKHIVRFYIKSNEGKAIFLEDVLKYYKKDKFKNLELPFKIGPMV